MGNGATSNEFQDRQLIEVSFVMTRLVMEMSRVFGLKLVTVDNIVS